MTRPANARHHEMHRRGMVLAAAALGIVACHALVPVPAIVSPGPVPTGAFRVGIGRADITPPPAGALMGNGSEGRRVRGYRERLYARALVMEDANGERLAYVVVDLGMPALGLQRMVAAQSGIGADRLILSATHTHSGPGHFFAVPGFDDFGSSLHGFDERMRDFLARQIATAVKNAAADLLPGRAIWGIDTLWGFTRNRSITAWRANTEPWRSRWPAPVRLFDEYRAVDPTLTMLRVEQSADGGRTFHPAAALSVFAMHATGNAQWNELFDADIHGLVARHLEDSIDAWNGRGRRLVPRAVHLFANGAEGDVSPDWRPGDRCYSPVPRPEPRPRGPRSPRAPDVWTVPDDNPPLCLEHARETVQTLGDSVGARAVHLYRTLGTLLADPVRAEAARRITLARSFAVVPLTGDSVGLCSPRIGGPTAVGNPDAITRFLGWRFFGFIDAGFDSSGAPEKPSRDCQTPKRVLVGKWQPLLTISSHPLPEHAQLSVTRVGGMVLGATPAELTTTVGGRMRAAIAEAARGVGAHPDSVALIGLANGYIYYVATPEEYQLQRYEGSSTLYGSGTAPFLIEHMRRLASTLPATGQPSPPATVPSLVEAPGRRASHFPDADAGPATVRREIDVRWSASRDTLIATWNDLAPGRLLPSDGIRVLVLRRLATTPAAAWDTVAWDDHPDVEVWARRSLGRRGYLWEARWAPTVRAGETFRVVLLRTRALPEVVSDDVVLRR